MDKEGRHIFSFSTSDVLKKCAHINPTPRFISLPIVVVTNKFRKQTGCLELFERPIYFHGLNNAICRWKWRAYTVYPRRVWNRKNSTKVSTIFYQLIVVLSIGLNWCIPGVRWMCPGRIMWPQAKKKSLPA